MFNIIDMDLRMPLQSFTDEADRFADEWENNNNVEVDVSIVPKITQRQNKGIYEITFTNKQLSGYEFVTYAEQGPNHTIALVPLLINGATCSTQLQDVANESTENDMALFAQSFFEELFTNTKGTLVYRTGAGPVIIKKGKKSGTAIEAIVDGSGKVYSALQTSLSVDGIDANEQEQSTTGAIKVVRKPMDILVNVWAKEDPETSVFVKDPNLSIAQKMDEVGKILINRRLMGQMDYETFHTLFEQAKVFGFTGNSPEINMVEKLILEDF